MERQAYLSKLHQIPLEVRQFLSRAFIILVVWKALYLVVLQPLRLPDAALTKTVGKQSAWVLKCAMPSVNFTSKDNLEQVQTENGVVLMHVQSVYADRVKIISVEDPCNALELIVLYAGFIICLPALVKDKIIYITGGIILIHIVNVIRCSGVGYMILNYPAHANFTHHYVFTFIVYGFIMMLWYLFSNRIILKPLHE